MSTAQIHLEVVRALEVAKAVALPFADGWIATICVENKCLSHEQKESITKHLVGKNDDEAGAYLVVVSDNKEYPIIFDSADAAMAQARHSGGSLISRYCFSVYSETGHTIQYIKKPTLHFMPGCSK